MEQISRGSGFNMMVINLRPRWRWFRPPLWKIFRWAYKVTDAVYYKDCYPVSINGKSTEPKDVTFTGTYKVPKLNIPEELLSDHAKAYYHWLAGLQDNADPEE